MASGPDHRPPLCQPKTTQGLPHARRLSVICFFFRSIGAKQPTYLGSHNSVLDQFQACALTRHLPFSVARIINLWIFWYLEKNGLRVDFFRDELAEFPPRLFKCGSVRRVTPTKKSYLQNVVAVVDRAASA
jgi:hypothetical protein